VSQLAGSAEHRPTVDDCKPGLEELRRLDHDAIIISDGVPHNDLPPLPIVEE
jgi:hypothetical protein